MAITKCLIGVSRVSRFTSGESNCANVAARERMVAPVEGESAMTTKHQNEDRELADNELEAITGGASLTTGFGVKTDANIAFQNAHPLAPWGFWG